MQTRFLNMQDLGNGITTVGNREDTFELSTEKLDKVRKDEPKLDKLAQDLWRKDCKNIWYASIYYEQFLAKMQNFVSDKIDEKFPDDIRPGVFFFDRLFRFENIRKSGRYFLILLAMDYLDILDEFLDKYKIEMDELLKDKEEY